MRFFKGFGILPLLGIMFLAAGTLQAADAPAKGARFQQRLQNDPAFRAEVDQNNDGTISDAERAKAREIFQERRQGRRQVWQQSNPELVKKLDTNKDGVLDKAEWEQGKEIRQQNRLEWLAKHPKATERLDTNNDGVVDQQEYQRGRQRQRARKQRQTP